MVYIRYFNESVFEEWEETIKIKTGDIFRFTYPDNNIIAIERLINYPDEDDGYIFKGYVFNKKSKGVVEKDSVQLNFFTVDDESIPSKEELDLYLSCANSKLWGAGKKISIKEAHQRRDEMEKEYNIFKSTKQFDM